jgi:branched-chain amino acid transport system substrate-binding protein
VTVLRAALVTPLTGPLAEYGRAGALALQLWAEWRGDVELDLVDAHPDPAAAAGRVERADLVFGPYGSGPARAVASATTRLVWNHGGAHTGRAPNLVDVLAPADTYFEGAVRAVHAVDPEVRTVCAVHGGTGFAQAVARGAVREAELKGLRGIPAELPGPPPDGELLLVAGAFADEVDAARRLLPGRWRAAAFVGAGVDEVLRQLGPAREGLLGPAQWLPAAAPTPDEGPSAAEFVAAYRTRAGTDPPYPAAQAFAAGVVAGRCLADAGTSEDGALRAAAAALRCTTLLGAFRLDPASGRQVGHQVLTVQWQDGVRRVVWPPERAQASLRHPLPHTERGRDGPPDTGRGRAQT